MIVGSAEPNPEVTKALRDFLSLSKRYVMNNATNSVVEGQMTPVQKQEDKQQTVLTGQYLYDTFMRASDSERTKMAIIRDWVEKGISVDIVAGACEGLVKRGFEEDKKLWTGPTNDNGVPIGDDGKKVRGVKEQSAMNARGIIQNAFGALKFARAELDKEGYSDETGYLAMRVVAKRALDDKRITWKGEAQKTDADKERTRLAKEQKEVIAARQKAMKDLPQNHGESDEDYFKRLQEFSKQVVESAKAEAEDNILKKLIDSLYEKHGQERMLALAFAILEREGIEVNQGENESEEQTELTEEEVAERMAEVPEEQAAH